MKHLALSRRWAVAAICMGLNAFAFSAPAHAQIFPDPDWHLNTHPEEQGWDVSALARLRAYIINETRITGFMIIHKGMVVFQYGDVEENSYIASCRKSVLAMIYGRYAKSGRIKLDRTLAEIGMDDVGGLLPVEQTARVRDIISSRSGVFHSASNPGDYLNEAPPRGSVAPGSYWLYSNWDFNAAGYIFEHETARNIYDEVERQLAVPLHMQDWHRSLQHKESARSLSLYDAYPMWLSTRDMARLGLLMLNRGNWRGRKILDKEWVAEMVAPRTSCAEVNAHISAYRQAPFCLGYGYMWWLWESAPDARMTGGYSAFGSMGQSLTIYPKVEAVIAYKTKEVYARETPFEARFRVLMMAVAALGSDSNSADLHSTNERSR